MHKPQRALAFVYTFVFLMALNFVFPGSGQGQETTAGVEGTVKDQSGATVAKAMLEISGSALIGTKTLETNASGYYRFINLPPGTYVITATASGFTTLKQEGIVLETGHLPTVNLTLKVGASATTVEVTAEAQQIDITQSRTQTNVSNDEIQYLPRGRSFQSVIALAPGARNEPLQGGFQVDGGATAENSYLVDGQETGSMITGRSAANVPLDFVQEVQIKTSGIEAENGGALGGVVNAIPKRGGNTWHGSLYTYYEGDPMDSYNAASNPTTSSTGSLTYLTGPGTVLRYDPQSTAYSTSARTDYPIQNYTPKKDHFRILQPGGEVGGYLKKDRLWLYLTTAPQVQTARRTVNFTTPTCTAAGNCSGVRQFNFSEQTYYSMARLDYKATEKIRLYAAWQYAFDRQTGNTFPQADSAQGLYNPSAANPVDAYQGAIGSVSPTVIFTTGADMTLTPNLIATTKFQRFYQNYGDRGLPVGDRYLWAVTASATTSSLNGSALGTANASAANSSGNYTIGPNEGYQYNINARTSFSQDLAYFHKGLGGVHNLKGGFVVNHMFDNVNQIFTNDLIRLGYGTTWSTSTTTGQTNCAAIAATNLTTYGKAGGSASGCQGNWGYVNIRDGNEVIGKASSNNYSLYAQDSWQITRGITANIGLRFEHENLPPYNKYPSGINFGWGDKIAPRLGGAWDVFQNGKLKVFASYGAFYDVMKLNLAIGSFGGNYWHDCAYALDTANYSQIKVVKDSTGHYCPAGGATVGANFASGTVPSGLRFIENVDYRIPSNDPSQGAAVDPNIKPYRQHESVFGADYQINNNWAFESRWTRRRLDHAIEDVGYVGANGEEFIIANPGFGTDKGGPTASCPTCKLQPKAERDYDAAEFRVTKAASSRWYGQFSYTYSRLRGNYSGLTSTDIADAGGGRANPNNNRAFDEPQFQFDASGNPSNGLLGTDRPHSFKSGLYYRVPLFKAHAFSIGGFEQASSGTPMSTYIDVNGSAGSYPVYPVDRGKWVDITKDGSGNWIFGNTYVRRTPWFVQTDGSITDDYKLSDSHETWRLGFEANVTNLLNHKAAVVYQSRPNASSGSTGNYFVFAGTTAAKPNYGLLEGGYDWKAIANSSAAGTRGPLVLSNEYGQPSFWQSGRSIRLKVKFTF